MEEVARRYGESIGRSKTASAVSRVLAGSSRSEALEAFIELEVLGVPRFSLFPERS